MGKEEEEEEEALGLAEPLRLRAEPSVPVGTFGGGGGSVVAGVVGEGLISVSEVSNGAAAAAAAAAAGWVPLQGLAAGDPGQPAAGAGLECGAGAVATERCRGQQRRRRRRSAGRELSGVL
ncbi:hypothetical protein GUJ93_ZPchr0229g18747 [Zizania palustris]|uniref:Uncharacterized protein n=1 Tax=Zizania palustris TaxID=103762 RepID=A0A8J5RND0_ZIZPA|nr:hypothetical protein GUJ93_ZPchr0229g18747 [Zizania palustris]